MKTIEFYAWNDMPDRRLIAPVHDTVVVILRDTGKLTCFRLDMAEAEKALADLNAAILKAQQ